MKEIDVIKIGGNVINDEEALSKFLHDLPKRTKPFVLVHGGGKLATSVSSQLGIQTKMVDGRRITDQQTLDVVVMIYAGLINKKIVAALQAININAIGLSGADGNIIRTDKQDNKLIDYGFVGDVNKDGVSVDTLTLLIDNGFTPVLSAITHDAKGQLLNTNADSIASVVAIALTSKFDVTLIYCFEKRGILCDDKKQPVISRLNEEDYQLLKRQGVIHSGMIPKAENAFNAVKQHVNKVFITHADDINNPGNGTELVG